MRRFVAVALAATVMLVAASSPGRAAVVTPAAPGIASSAGWIVGAGFLAVVSTMICAHVIGKAEGREMTGHEAVWAMTLPLSCLYRKK